MVTSGVGLFGTSSRFYEQNGVSFGFGMGGRGPVRCIGGFGGSPAMIPFAGAGGWLNGGLRAGWSVRGGSSWGRMGFYAYQGSHRSLVSSTGVVNGLTGYPISFFNGVYSPYVVGVVPVGSQGAFAVMPFGVSWPMPAGRVPYRTWSEPWWPGVSSRRFPDRSYPVVAPRETLADRFRAARRRRVAEWPASHDSRTVRPPVDTSVRGLSGAAFRQLGGRPSRR